jgi:energy-coupling factor transporter ATP-binding protein EcfA2
MITELEITNFRCFKHTKQDGLRRFNFIVGPSGSGKTAFTEALFLISGSSPEIYFRLRKWRGFGDLITLTGTRDSYESLFRDLFYNFHQDVSARIEFKASTSGHRSLDIFYKGDEVLHLPIKTSLAESDDVFSVTPIVFKWTGQKKVTEAQVEIGENGGLRMKGSRDIYPMHFVSSQTLDPKGNAYRYSDLSKLGRSKLVLESMQKVYPEITELSLEFIAGDPMLHASIAGRDQKYPIASLSGGMNKYLSIVLALMSLRRGALVVDEIENGFYYKDQVALMRGIMELAIKYETQLFATTHSYELLQSVGNVIINNPELQKETALIRLEKSNPEAPPLIHLSSGNQYAAAIESDFEVR